MVWMSGVEYQDMKKNVAEGIDFDIEAIDYSSD
jgi:hypothetical protein